MKLTPKNKAVVATMLLSAAMSQTTVFAEQPNKDLKYIDEVKNDGVLSALQRGLMDGYENQSFQSDKNLSRAEFAALITRIFHIEVKAKGTSSFKDVVASSWASPYIEALYEKGWMTGTGNSFQPNESITKEQVAVVLTRALGLKSEHTGVTTPSDLSTASSWARESLLEAIQAGIIKTDNGNVHPQSGLIRQEAASIAVFVSNLLPLVIEDITDSGQIKVSGISYTAKDEVKGIFAAKNRNVLRGAKLTAVIRDHQIQSIQQLELVAPGQAASQGSAEFSANLKLDGDNATIGHLKVNADYVSVVNVKVNGDLEIGTGLQHDFYSNGLVVGGITRVLGGDDNTVVFDNANLKNVVVNKPDVRVEAKGKTTIGEVTVNSNATIEANAEVIIPKLTIGEGVAKVQINSNVETLEILGSKSSLTLGSSVKVQNVKLPTGGNIKDIISNFDQVTGSILMINNVQNQSSSSSSSSNSYTSPSVSADKAELYDKIGEANTLLAGATIGTNLGQYPQSAAVTLTSAISVAQDVYADVSVSQTNVNGAVVKLNQALVTFKQSIIVDKGTLYTQIGAASDLLQTSVIGWDVGQYLQSQATILGDSITVAQAVYDNTTVSQVNITTAVTDLNQAIVTFQQSVIGNKDTLYARIGLASTTLQNASIGTGYFQYPQSAVDALTISIGVAQSVYGTVYASQSVLDSAVITLDQAVSSFQSSVMMPPFKTLPTITAYKQDFKKPESLQYDEITDTFIRIV
ncbi:hypothetical protein GC102_38050 [Paenibacillus sp. LMG 31460]|uniref:SLH domain-containing protein n=1 Tax=Paenibacillus germinis TaxID=2654979 RepID=A0ABX1ZH35_9BACL|nr:S-layer homology domain-containing protein [Paenibacillus germinis]NOU91489.1 hypothetical protein [Paenibacillus germinis]